MFSKKSSGSIRSTTRFDISHFVYSIFLRVKTFHYGKLLTLCLPLVTIPALGQVNIDSLKSVWNDPNKTDSIRLEALHQISWYGYLFSHPDSSFYFSQLQYDLANEIDNKSYMADALFIQGVSLTIRGNYLEAIGYQERSLPISKEIGDEEKMALSYNNLGINYAELGDLASSMDYFVRFLSINEKLGNEVRAAGAMVNIGNMHVGLEDYATAKEYLIRGLAKAEQIDHKRLIQNGSNGLGNVYSYNEQYDSALFYYQRCLSIAKELGDKGGQVSPLNSIGVINEKRGDYPTALDYYQSSLNLAEEVGRKTDISGANINFGMIHLAMADSAASSGNKTRSAEMYQKALNYGTKALAIAQEIEHKAKVEEAAQLLSKVYQATAQYKEALEMYQLFISSRDSIVSEKNQREVIRQGFQYTYDKKKLTDDLMHEAELEKELNQRYALYIILGTSLLFLTIVYRAWRIRRKLSSELEISYAKLKELNEYKESMTAMINHDLRSPLTLINGYVSRILTNEDNYLTTESTDDLGNLKRNAVKLIEMSEEFQELLLLKDGRLKLNFVELEMNHYLHVLVGMFSSIAEERGIALEYFSIEGEKVLVRVDHQHFDKIVYNLLTNAIKYTEEGGSVKVKLAIADHHCELYFEDTGKGISAKHLPMVFDRYYQPKDREDGDQKGYGIGLAVVKELVELHGGEVYADSKENVGTRIKIQLPFNLDKEISKEVESPDLEKVSDVKSQFRSSSNAMVGQIEEGQSVILVVDDQEEIRSYITDLIRDLGQIKHASNGKEALKLLEKEQMDLIITDLMMPWLDGFELIKEIKKNDRLSQIPVMVISARTSEEDRLKILDQGVNNLISKPFNPEELKKRIKILIAQQEEGANAWDEIVKGKDILTNVEQDVLKKLNQIIVDRIDDPSLSIEIIAHELSASRSKAINLIKNLTGKTPLVYMKGIRMDYVSHLIKTEKVKNSSEAAKSIGMTNTTQFSNQYQKHFGRKPF